MLVIGMNAVDQFVLEVGQGNVGAVGFDQSGSCPFPASGASLAFHDNPVCPDVG